MSRFQSKVEKAVKVFTKVQKDLEKVIDDASGEVVKIDNMITELNADKLDIQAAVQTATNIKQKILSIVGDDA